MSVMLPRFFNNLGIQLTGAALILLVTIFVEIPFSGKFAAVLQNSGHAPAYGLLSLIVVNALRSQTAASIKTPFGARRDLWLCAYALIIVVLLGIATEVIQGLLHRDAELEDVLHDVIGAICALSGWMYVQSRRASPHPRWQARFNLAIFVVSFGCAITPLFICAAAYWHRQSIFPVLAQFRSPLDLYFVAPTDPNAIIQSNSDQNGQVDNSGLYNRLNNGSWPGITITEPAPDWHNYTEMLVDVSNPGTTPLPLAIRIDDTPLGNRYDDRFNYNFSVAAGERLTLHIPLESIAKAPHSRRMDLKNISQIILFHSGAATGQALLLHRIWLQ